VGRVQLTLSGRWQNLLGEMWQNLRCTACGHVHHINVAHLKCCQKCPLILPPATLAEQCNMVLPSSAGRNCFKIALHTCMQIEIASSTNFHHAEKINIIFWQSSSIHGEGCIYIQHRIPKAIIHVHDKYRRELSHQGALSEICSTKSDVDVPHSTISTCSPSKTLHS
jgi:hypothetical protein